MLTIHLSGNLIPRIGITFFQKYDDDDNNNDDDDDDDDVSVHANIEA
jgi:hypothetical protein